MARNTEPVLKRCRALGINPAELGFSKIDKKKKPYNQRKMKGYAVQLREKQKVKFIYGILEKQFRNYYNKAEGMRGITGENMLLLLERRLDNVVYRMGLAKTRPMARQIVNHGLITVNGKRVNIPSFIVKKGDIIKVADKKKDKQVFSLVKELAPMNVPRWLNFDNSSLSGEVLELPLREDIKENIQEHLIVELYSK